MKVNGPTELPAQTEIADVQFRSNRQVDQRHGPSRWGGNGGGIQQQVVDFLKQRTKSELKELREIPRSERTPEQKNQIKELKAQLRALR